MSLSSVIFNLFLLLPLASFSTYLLMPRQERMFPLAFWAGIAVISNVPLGCFIVALSSHAWGEPMNMTPFSWIEQPGKMVAIILVCGTLGGCVSFVGGTMCSRLLHCLKTRMGHRKNSQVSH